MKSVEYSELNDEQLFELYQLNDDHKAFKVLYGRYGKRMLSYCFRVSGDRETARDLFQQVMANIIDKKGNFRGGNFLAWLMTITRNICLMHKRTNRQMEQLTENSWITNEQSDFAMNDAVRKAVDNLSEEFKEVIELYYFDSFSYDQIAKICDISDSLVKVRLHRAKKQLLNTLSPLRSEINGL